MADEHVLFDVLLPEYQKFYSEKVTEVNPFGNVIYIRKGMSVVNSGTVLSDVEGAGFANYIIVKDDINDTETVICNVHGIPYPGHKLDTPERLEQSSVLIKKFESYRHVVIGGDFNLLPEAKSVKTFSSHGFNDLVKQYEIKTTRNNYAFDKYPGSHQYYADYVFTSPAIDVKRFSVPVDIVSDHQPLLVSI